MVLVGVGEEVGVLMRGRVSLVRVLMEVGGLVKRRGDMEQENGGGRWW